jgi:monovalent cation:H+ antiporter-2, CPA2 family
MIGSILTCAGAPFTVVENDARLAEGLGGRKLHALRGEAMAESVLEAAGVRYARVLVLAIPDGYQARRVLETARRLHPSIQTAVRIHSESEYTHLQDVGVGFVVLGERELALTIADYTLSCFGLLASRRPSTVQPPGTSAS